MYNDTRWRMLCSFYDAGMFFKYNRAYGSQSINITYDVFSFLCLKSKAINVCVNWSWKSFVNRIAKFRLDA